MIILVAAALAAAAPAADACPEVITPDAEICRAIHAQAAGDSAAAAQAFEQAAVASSDKDPATARMWAAAGNMWIAVAQYGKASLALDKALALPGLEAEQRGEALLDRARAAEALGDLKTARDKLSLAAESAGDDPFYWYFSAAVAIREGDKAVAQSAIGKALTLAPDDAMILFEAGHVAQFNGDDARAKDYWTRASAADPAGTVGKAARDAIALLAAPPAPPPAAKRP
ncbi:MAG: hypothetical protein QFB89_06940 [Pseudomonadota bacterium]|nr:hypothetical protein [Pseudomonadota bacterium]